MNYCHVNIWVNIWVDVWVIIIIISMEVLAYHDSLTVRDTSNRTHVAMFKFWNRLNNVFGKGTNWWTINTWDFCAWVCNGFRTTIHTKKQSRNWYFILGATHSTILLHIVVYCCNIAAYGVVFLCALLSSRSYRGSDLRQNDWIQKNWVALKIHRSAQF